MRENTASGIIHPEFQGGRRLWLDGQVRGIVDKLHNGDPTLGWEGDPRLALYLEPDPLGGERWALYRYEADGQYRKVCQSKPGLALDERLIQLLVAHDQRRGFDIAAFAAEHTGN